MITFFGQLVPNAVEQDPANWSLYTTVVAVAMVIGWGLHALYLYARVGKLKSEKMKIETENNKLKEEEIKIAGDTLKEIIHHRERYSGACQKCKVYGRNLISLIKKDADNEEINSEREKFCDVFSRDAFDSFSAYCQFESLSLKNRIKELHSFVREELVPELERLNDWKNIINHHAFLEQCQKTPLKIEKRSLRPFFEISRFFPEEEKESIDNELSSIIETLQK